ncbi:thermopsin [Vulcanisaeta sp. JCM 14467]
MELPSNSLGLLPLLIIIALLGMALITDASYVVEVPPVNVFNETHLTVNSSFVYTYANMSGGIIYLRPGWYYPYGFNASAGSYIYYNIWSTSMVTLYILNGQEYGKFISGNVSEYLYSMTGTDMVGYYQVRKSGTYYVVISDNGLESSLVLFTISISGSPTPKWAFPMGIADYGIAVVNGTYFAYDYITNEFIGNVTIYKALTQEPSACLSGYAEPGSNWFSVQLNTVMVVNTAGGQTQYYWLQNVVWFDSLNGTVWVVDNVWNFSSINSVLSNATVSGNGVVYSLNNSIYVYEYLVELTPKASLPFSISLVTRTGLSSNGYPWISFGYLYTNGSITWYDNITIKVPAVSAYMEVSPMPTGNGLPDDAELIVAGPWNWECTTAKSLNTSLMLYFAWPYPSDEYLSPVPATWDFGEDTGETIYNAHVSLINYGEADVLNGPEELSFLSTYFIPLTIINPLNESSITNIYTINSTVTINEPMTVTVVPNESRYLLADYVINGTYTITSRTLHLVLQGPTSIYINYTLQYMLTIEDPSGLLSGLGGWYDSGDVVTLSEPLVYNLGNGTRLLFRSYDIYLTGTELSNLVINNTARISINSPYTVIVNWTRQYLVIIHSKYPVSINGTETTNLTGWFYGGEELAVAPATVFSDGLFLSEPGLNITVDKPLNVDVRWSINYVFTVLTYLPLIIIITIITMYITRKHHTT